MSLQAAIKFLKGAVARNLPGKSPSIYSFHDGVCYAQNSAALAAHPVAAILGTFALSADGLESALARFGTEPEISDGGNLTIALKAGRIRSVLRLLHADPPTLTEPTEGWIPVPAGLPAALRMVIPFISDQGTWQQGVKLGDGVIAAINNRNAIEVQVDGLGFGQTLLLGGDCVGYIAGVDDPVEMNHDGALYFRWPSGAWLRCQLPPYEWPDVADRILDIGIEEPPVEIDAAWRSAFDDAAALGEGDVEVCPAGLVSRIEHMTTEIDLETDVALASRWAFKTLAPVIKVATRWDPDNPQGHSRFTGPGIRGIVMAVRG